MSFVGSLFGQNGTGLNFRAQSADLVTPTTAAQADQTYQQSQDALAQQQAFLQALQGQNGIQNQSNVFNQLQGVANGTGPNPAQAMLAQQTGNNVAAQAALQAGQRGSSANPAAIARQAAQQGGNMMQQAAGQGASLQAQQSLNALNQLGGIAGQQVGQQQGATQFLNQAAQGEQQNILNALAQQNQNKVANVEQMNQANAGIANTAAQGQYGILSGLMKGASGGAAATAKAHGGMIGMAEGGKVPSGPKSRVGGFLSGMGQGMQSSASPYNAMQDGVAGVLSAAIPMVASALAPAPVAPASQAVPGVGHATPQLAKGGKVPVKVSPGELYLRPEAAKQVAEGKANPLAVGKKIPGKAKVKGDSYANDTVDAELDVGGVVVPKSKMESNDPMEHARRFVEAVYAQSGKKRLPKKKAK